jgi:hypothetical protein
MIAIGTVLNKGLMPYRWHSCFYYPPTQGSTMFAALHIVPHLGYRNVIPSGFKFHPRAFNAGADAAKHIENQIDLIRDIPCACRPRAANIFCDLG